LGADTARAGAAAEAGRHAEELEGEKREKRRALDIVAARVRDTVEKNKRSLLAAKQDAGEWRRRCLEAEAMLRDIEGEMGGGGGGRRGDGH
jgi:hypothetical protein